MAVRGNELHATVAHPALYTGRDADGQGKRRQVFSHNGAGGDKGKAPDFDAAHDGAIRAEADARTDDSFFKFIFARNMRAGIHNVGKHGRWTAEHVVAEFHHVIERNIILHPAAAADFHFVADVGILPKGTLGPDRDVLAADMAKVPNLSAGANDGAWVDDRGGVNKRFHLNAEYNGCLRLEAMV